MDLSPARFDRDEEAPLSTELAVLLAGVGARQAASATARVQAGLVPAGAVPLLAPSDGAFNAGVARGLAARRIDRKGQ